MAVVLHESGTDPAPSGIQGFLLLDVQMAHHLVHAPEIG